MTADVTLTDAEQALGIMLVGNGEEKGLVYERYIVEQIVADRLAAERERIAQAIESEASDSSYRDPEEATLAYLAAARIARGTAFVMSDADDDFDRNPLADGRGM